MIAGFNIDDVIVAMAALAAALNVYVLYRALLVRDPMGARVKSLAARREALRQGMMAPRRRASDAGRERSMGLMRRVVGSELGVKASGGVRTAEDAIKMAQAGANRLGASASVAIVTGASDGKSKGY